MSKRVMLASIVAMLTVGGLAYGLNGSTSRSETCPLEGTPACPKVACAQAGTPACTKDQTVTIASIKLPTCCQVK